MVLEPSISNIAWKPAWRVDLLLALYYSERNPF